MKLLNKDGLLGKLTLSILFTAVAVGFIASELFYRVVYNASFERAQVEISMLHETVAATSSIAAYLNDTELANEVVNGLAVNGVILGAKLTTQEMAVTNTNFIEKGDMYKFAIKSPFSDTEVGELLIVSDTNFITNRAQDNASYNTQALLIQALIITVVSILNVFFLVSKPLTFISNQLSKITPPSTARIKHPAFHKRGELGSLVKDVNSLLIKTESSLNDEQKYRKEIEILEQRFRLVFDHANNPIVLTDSHGNLVLSNNAFSSLLEQTSVKMQKNLGSFLSELFEDASNIEESFRKQLSLTNTASGECKLKGSNQADKAKWYQVIATVIRTDEFKDYMEISLHDISNKKQKLEELSNSLEKDPLTNALSRSGLSAKLELMNHVYTNYAVIFININGFKAVNEKYGLGNGDQLLKAVVARCKTRIRQDDVICRWSCDEFVLILAQVNERNVDAIIEDISRVICQPLSLNGYEGYLEVSASIGVALYPSQGDNSSELIQRAEEALRDIPLNERSDTLSIVKFAG